MSLFAGDTTGFNFLVKYHLFSKPLFFELRQAETDDLSLFVNLNPGERVVPIELDGLDLGTDIFFNVVLRWENEGGIDDTYHIIDIEAAELRPLVVNLFDALNMVMTRI